MGKLTLAVLVLAIALGVYWFWWSDQGANSPITVEGTISMTGISELPGTSGLRGMGSGQKVDFTLQAAPNKLRLAGTLAGKELSAIVSLSKRKMYILNKSNRTYTEEEFDLVEMSKTEKAEKAEETWPKEFKRTADWDYIGTGDGKRFCNKQTVPTAKGGVWFTPDTRLGRRYFSTINKLARVNAVGRGGKGPISSILGAPVPGMPKTSGKRPQVKYVNLDFFPIPMKADLSVGPMRIKLDVKRLSRKKIPKDVFEVPSDYKKVSADELLK